jgi:hypothetical protein
MKKLDVSIKSENILTLFLESTICIFGLIGVILSLFCGYDVYVEIKPINKTKIS